MVYSPTLPKPLILIIISLPRPHLCHAVTRAPIVPHFGGQILIEPVLSKGL